jgi:hypothetical protein
MNTNGIVPSDSRIFSVNLVDEYAIGGIQGESLIAQTFLAKQDVERIGVRLATYGRINPGEIYFRVYDPESGDTYSYETIQAAMITDNKYHEFVLGQVMPARSRPYAFELSGTTTSFYESIGVWASRMDTYPDGILLMSEFEYEGDLAFYLVSPEPIGVIKPILQTVVFILLFIAIIIAYIIISRRWADHAKDSSPDTLLQ